MKPANGLIILEIATYPPPDRGIALPKIEYPTTIVRAKIPTMRRAITLGGIPANHKFSGKGTLPVAENPLSNGRKAQPVTARIIMNAVNGPISLTRPVVSLANDFFPSDKASQAKKV